MQRGQELAIILARAPQSWSRELHLHTAAEQEPHRRPETPEPPVPNGALATPNPVRCQRPAGVACVESTECHQQSDVKGLGSFPSRSTSLPCKCFPRNRGHSSLKKVQSLCHKGSGVGMSDCEETGARFCRATRSSAKTRDLGRQHLTIHRQLPKRPLKPSICQTVTPRFEDQL